jgi:hypothetical protein
VTRFLGWTTTLVEGGGFVTVDRVERALEAIPSAGLGMMGTDIELRKT